MTAQPIGLPRRQSKASAYAAAMCPVCEGREPRAGEEAYAACILCATGASPSHRLPQPPAPVQHEKRCEFPPCEDLAEDGPMCKSHRLVSVSSTGSWLEDLPVDHH